MKIQNGAILSIAVNGKWLFTGGWDKTINVQELSGDEISVNCAHVGSIPGSSVITSLLYWEGKLFAGFADKTIKVIIVQIVCLFLCIHDLPLLLNLACNKRSFVSISYRYTILDANKNYCALQFCSSCF
jgi:hypothetical protein